MTVGAFQFHAINPKVRCESSHDNETGILLGIPRGAMCVQRFDDSLNSAIHITYRISLRSSSMREPRDPLLKVLTILMFSRRIRLTIHKQILHVMLRQVNPLEGEACRSNRVVNTNGGWRFGPTRDPKLCNDPSAGSPTETLLRLL